MKTKSTSAERTYYIDLNMSLVFSFSSIQYSPGSKKVIYQLVTYGTVFADG